MNSSSFPTGNVHSGQGTDVKQLTTAISDWVKISDKGGQVNFILDFETDPAS